MLTSCSASPTGITLVSAGAASSRRLGAVSGALVGLLWPSGRFSGGGSSSQAFSRRELLDASAERIGRPAGTTASAATTGTGSGSGTVDGVKAGATSSRWRDRDFRRGREAERAGGGPQIPLSAVALSSWRG